MATEEVILMLHQLQGNDQATMTGQCPRRDLSFGGDDSHSGSIRSVFTHPASAQPAELRLHDHRKWPVCKFHTHAPHRASNGTRSQGSQPGLPVPAHSANNQPFRYFLLIDLFSKPRESTDNTENTIDKTFQMLLTLS